jgi:hypothetical protein
MDDVFPENMNLNSTQKLEASTLLTFYMAPNSSQFYGPQKLRNDHFLRE